MPTNKNAQIRYQALDCCLSNWSRRFYIEDLVEACNRALQEFNGVTKEGGAVKKRQVLDDLNFLESTEGYSMLIERLRDGHRVYFRYAERNASIKTRPINQQEVDLMHDALMLLRRFEGVPQFEWLDDLQRRLYSTSQLGQQAGAVVSFQSNPYLKGMSEYYKPLFDAIVCQRVVELQYHPFGKDVRREVVSPYFLKQYNNRWFLIAKRLDSNRMSNYAIDRIEGVTETSKAYDSLDPTFDFEEFFADVVGVSVTDAPVDKVVLRVAPEALGYVTTKPLHESQSTSPQPTPDGRYELSLQVKDNYELRSLLRSFGSLIEVMSPLHLRQEMREEACRVMELYGEE